MSQSISQKHTQHVTLHLSLSIVYSLFLQTQTLVFQQWSERRVKAELSSAVLNLCHSNASDSREKLLKHLFYLSPSRIDIIRCADRTLSSWHPAVKKTHTHTRKYLKLNPPNTTALLSHGANLRDLSYPEILTGAPNGEGREDRTYKLSKKNHIHRVVNPTLT
jgi:hypothetical protein